MAYMVSLVRPRLVYNSGAIRLAPFQHGHALPVRNIDSIHPSARLAAKGASPSLCRSSLDSRHTCKVPSVKLERGLGAQDFQMDPSLGMMRCQITDKRL